MLAYERRAPGSSARVALNFESEPRALDLGGGRVAEVLSTDPARKPPETAGRVELGPSEGIALILG